MTAEYNMKRGAVAGPNKAAGIDPRVVRVAKRCVYGACASCAKHATSAGSFIVNQKNGFIAVADAVGSTQVVRRLSRLACAGAYLCYIQQGSAASGAPRLKASFTGAAAITRLASEGLVGRHATSLILAELDQEHVRAVWAGDSVCYRLRKGRLSRQTIPEACHRILVRAIGLGKPGFNITRFDLVEGDRLLVCTDGIWRNLTQKRMLELLLRGDDSASIASSIVEEVAGLHEGDATCVVVLVGDSQADHEGSVVFG